MNISMKALVALVMGAVAVAVVNVAGITQGKPDMPVGIWVSCAVLAILCTLVFAALGVFVGYLVPAIRALLAPAIAAAEASRERGS